MTRGTSLAIDHDAFAIGRCPMLGAIAPSGRATHNIHLSIGRCPMLDAFAPSGR